MSKARYCYSCRKKNIKGRYKICTKCSKKKIDDNGQSKANGPIVYGLYDNRNELVYVGVSNSMTHRVAQHLNQKTFDKMKVIKRFATRREADAFEIFAIHSLRPPLNIKTITPEVEFNSRELLAFGKVAKEARIQGKTTCVKCDTVLSRYNSSKYCRRHK